MDFIQINMDEYEKFPVEDLDSVDRTQEDKDIDEVNCHEINNTFMTQFLNQKRKCFSIRLNREENAYEKRKNKLKQSDKILKKLFSKLCRIHPEERLHVLVNTAFPEGMPCRMFIRTLSFGRQNSERMERDSASLGIRPAVIEGGNLSKLLGEKNGLIFIGHIHGKEFVVDQISDTLNTECLPYEVECVASVYADPSRVWADDIQFLYDIRTYAESLTEYTTENLTAWREYLDWREEVASLQIKGCKYFDVAADDEKFQLKFSLVFDSREEFLEFQKYLSKDIQAFSNDYSIDPWRFCFECRDSDSGKQRRYSKNLELGRFQRIIREYELNPQLVVGEDDDETVCIERTLCSVYPHPYIVEAAFAVRDSDMERIRKMNQKDALRYIRKKVLPVYDKQGFLGLSAVGTFTVINRQKRAVRQLEQGESYSPNLGAWLFNIQQARCPEGEPPRIDTWLDHRIANQESQRRIVEGVMMTEDVTLIQGPPGTGKTTIIAEVGYQNVRQGKRVLIASQSNDAVDNALERLVNAPEIRAIRVGQAVRRERQGEDFVEGDFSGKASLKRYYQALSDSIQLNILDFWDKIEKKAGQFEYDLREVRLIGEDIQEFEKKQSDDLLYMQQLREELKQSEREKNYLKNCALEREAEQRYLKQFEQSIEREEKHKVFLSAGQLAMAADCLAPAADYAEKSGIRFLSHGLEVEQLGLDGANDSLNLALHQYDSLKNIRTKLTVFKQTDTGRQVEEELLRTEIRELEQKMLEETDEKLVVFCWNQIKVKKKELEKFYSIHTDIRLADGERELLGSVYAALQDHMEEGKHTLDQLLQLVKCGLENTVKKLYTYMESKIPIDSAPLEQKIRQLEGRLLRAEEELIRDTAMLQNRRERLAELKRTYGISSEDVSEIENELIRQRDDYKDKIQLSRQTRELWGDTMAGFVQRLRNEDLFFYDTRYYLDTYEKSCNIVGSSCTDRVLAGEELGVFDLVIIDEVSKVTPPELLMALLRARSAVLVGDHRQLPPMFEEHERSYSELLESEDIPQLLREKLTMADFNRFKRMVTASLFKEMFEDADERIKFSLLTQYRMHSDIMAIINRFYENRLESGFTPQEEMEKKNHGLTVQGIDGSPLISPENHAYWLDSSALPGGEPIYDSFNYRTDGNNQSTSAYNLLEIHMILELLQKLDEANRAVGGEKKTVGIISFYQAQINRLRKQVRNMRSELTTLDIDINTVDRFQGKEKQIIITSLVRNNPKGRAGKHVVAFERINVAFSRAQELLVIVGAVHMYENLMIELPNMDQKGSSTVPAYRNIISLLERRGCLKGSEKLITSEMAQELLERCKEGEKKY